MQHQHTSRRFGRILGFALAALASCYLGLLAAHLLWQVPHLLVAAFTDAEVVSLGRLGSLNLLPALYVLQPTEAPPLAFAVYAAGALVLAALSLAASSLLARLCSGWARLTLVFFAFWTCALIGASAAAFALRGVGPLAAFAGMLGGTSSAVARWTIAALVVMICWLCLTHLLQSLEGEPGSPGVQRALRLALWFLLPAFALSMTLTAAAGRVGRIQPFGGSFGLLLMAVPAALAATWFGRKPRSPFQPTMRGAIAALAAGGVCLAAMAAYSSAARQPAEPEFDSLTSRHWEIAFEQGAFSVAERRSSAEAADRRIEQYSRRLGIPLQDQRLHSRVFLSTKNKRALTPELRDDPPFTLGGEPLTLSQLLPPRAKAADRVIAASPLEGADQALADPRGEPLLLMASAWGTAPSQQVAAAIARYAAGNFFNQPLSGYARRIACEERAYSLAETLGISPRYLSPLVRDALGGAWIESLAEDRGIEILPRLYRAIPAEEGPGTIASALGVTWHELESDWQSYLTPTAAPCESPNGPGATRSAAARRAAATASATASPVRVHQGISFSHEVGGDWGYGSDSAQNELEKIRQIGADTVAIIPYAFTRAPDETAIRFRTDETDARVMRSIEQARRCGLGVMLKPHLWGRGFTGDIQFESGEDFASWWESYRAWLLHFARLAELHGVELLALGNELGGLTVREAAWRELIRDVRRIYAGELTYAAHWDGEFERIRFWSELDYIGVNAYFPLAKPGEAPHSDAPGVARIRARLAALAERFGKPVLFTEVGFPSMHAAAVEPWTDGNGALDLEIQKQCYAVIFESFTPEPWFAGAYWWKWPSHGRGGPYDLSHRPNGKPAMDVLRWWFQSPQVSDRSLTESTRSRGR